MLSSTATHARRVWTALSKALACAMVVMLVLFPWQPAPALAVDVSQKDALQAQADDLFARIDSLQTDLAKAEEDHAVALRKHDEAMAAMAEAQVRIEAADARAAEVRSRLGDRAVEMYKGSGASSLLEVMLGSATFEEFIVGFDMFSRVANKDASLVQEAKDLRAEAEAARLEFEHQAQAAESEMRAAETLQAEIEAHKSELQAQVDSITADIAEIEAEMELQAEAAAAAAAASSYTADYVFTPSTEPAQTPATATGSATGSAGGGSGIFANPCPTATTSSGYGWRAFDNSFHKGTDMAAPMGTPYYAAEAGTVLIARFSASAGNWIVISHGNGLVTKYMHSSALHVKAGDRVERGQHIGDVGSTGYSTGPHLHFQVELNGKVVCPYDYL